MAEIDAQRWVLPGLLALLILGAFFIVVTNGGGDDSSAALDRPAQSTRTSTTTTSAKANATATKTSTTPPAPVAASSGRFVEVQAGDTPTSIADRSGISVERLLDLNPSIDPDLLKPGQTLKLAR
jgi:LysM repeat protein